MFMKKFRLMSIGNKNVINMKETRNILVLIAVVLSVLMNVAICTAEEDCERCHQDIVANFTTSLHHTGSGMYEEYEKGAAGHFGIEMDEYYDKFKCAKCHAVSCKDCHPGENAYESHLYEVTIDTCSKCHDKKQSSTYEGYMPMHKAKGPNSDVHYEAGILCQDCHAPDELHGDGLVHETQLNATNVKCEGCHKEVTETRSHTAHDGKVDCSACHSGWMLTCQNCHLDTRKGMTTTTELFLLGIANDGKIKPFLIMDAIIGNETHSAYGAWYPHTTTATGKECAFCHENPDVLGQGLSGQIVGEGGSLLPQETIDRVLAADLSDPEDAGLIARILNLFGL